jgi:Yip1 domain
MNIIDRVKNILITPKTEWHVIGGESATPATLLTNYVLPLAVFASLGAVLQGVFFAGKEGFIYFVITGVIAFVAAIIAFYLSAYIIDMLAPSFASEKNLNKSAQLVAYANTPTYIVAILSFIPVIGWMLSLAAWIYSLYLMYLGIGLLKRTPEDKKVVYMIVSFVIMIALYLVLITIIGLSLYGIMGYGGSRMPAV